MNRKELHKKLIKNDYCLEIKFKHNFEVGSFGVPKVFGVVEGEKALLTNVEYDQRVFFNYPQSVAVIDIVVNRLSKRQVNQIDKGMAFIPADKMEKQCNAEIVLPEEIDFYDVFEIIEEV